jgi:hypothetical protein
MNYCKNCRHFRFVQGEVANCAKFAKVKTVESLVWGMKELRSYPSCEEARSENGQCGINGAGWEPVEINEEPMHDLPWYARGFQGF